MVSDIRILRLEKELNMLQLKTLKQVKNWYEGMRGKRQYIAVSRYSLRKKQIYNFPEDIFAEKKQRHCNFYFTSGYSFRQTRKNFLTKFATLFTLTRKQDLYK